jgi:hypothetical protein
MVEKKNYLKNFFNSIKFIIISYVSFGCFLKKNSAFFKKNINLRNAKIQFSFKILIAIIAKFILNKFYLLFFFNERKKYYINFKNEELNINAEWFKNNAFYWDIFFKKFSLYKKKLQILEIGSFEGYSSVFFLKNFKNSKLTCVDLWKNNKEQKKFSMTKTERIFDKNTYIYKKNLLKLKQSSDHFFKKNYNKNKFFDIIYVDGDHFYKTVFRDLINSYNVLKKNGLMIIDDLPYNFYQNRNHNPISAIAIFLTIFYKEIKILKVTNQIIIKKL